jgi:energy-coupling factor transporter ATP-binding protein EcfA2
MHLLAGQGRGFGSRALHFSSGDGYPLEFRIDEAGRRVEAVWSRPDESAANLDTLLLGPALRCVLGLRGVMCIHAAVIAAAGGAIAIAGPKGAGKSTLTATLARAGHAVLADDLAVLDERRGEFWAHSGPPRLGLWPETLAALGEEPDRWPRGLTTMEKRWRALAAEGGAGAWRHEPAAQRLVAIYVLADTGGGPSPTVEPLPVPEALVRLTEHTSPPYLTAPLPGTAPMRRLARLVGHVPVLEVRHRRGLDALPALADAIAGVVPAAS